MVVCAKLSPAENSRVYRVKARWYMIVYNNNYYEAWKLSYYIGEEHNISFVWCACEPLVLTMVRARIWPSAPRRPNLAFTFDLLDWAESLLLECQVALKDFCKALFLKCPHLVKKVIQKWLVSGHECYFQCIHLTCSAKGYLFITDWCVWRV